MTEPVQEKKLAEYKSTLETYLSDNENATEVIKALEELKDAVMTKELLVKSKLGVVVNKVRKAEGDDGVQKAATDLLSKWKELMLSEPVKPEKRKLEESEPEVKVAENKPAVSSSTSLERTDSPKPVAFDLKNFSSGDSVRDKCLEMLVNALMTDQSDQQPDEIVITTAQGIEKCLFEEFKTVSSAYKAKLRSKYLNLKDLKNPTLRSALISGMINPERFCQMTAAEMASDERKKLDAKMAEQNLLNAQAAKDTQAETDQFKCSRCQKRKCKYYQMQTRSADEPMTTFVSCLNCGNRWRFC